MNKKSANTKFFNALAFLNIDAKPIDVTHEEIYHYINIV